MNKVYVVKRNAHGQSVVCSEKTKARGKVKSMRMVFMIIKPMLLVIIT